MVVAIVTACLSLKVIVANALMTKRISGVRQKKGYSGFLVARTYLHSGITAARASTPDISTPSSVRLLLLTLRLVNTLMAKRIPVVSGVRGQRRYSCTYLHSGIAAAM